MAKPRNKSALKRQRAKDQGRMVRRISRLLSPEVRIEIGAGLHPDLIEAARKTERQSRRPGSCPICIMEQINRYRRSGVAGVQTVAAMESCRLFVTCPLVALAEDLNRLVDNPVYGVSSSIEWEPGRPPRIVVEVGRYQTIFAEGRRLYRPPRACDLGPISYSKHFLLRWSKRVLGPNYKEHGPGWIQGHAPLLPGKSIAFRPDSEMPGMLAVDVPFHEGLLIETEPDSSVSPESLVHHTVGFAPFVTLRDGTRVLKTFLPLGANRTPGAEGWLDGEDWDEALPRTAYSMGGPEECRKVWDYSGLLPRRPRESVAAPLRTAAPS